MSQSGGDVNIDYTSVLEIGSSGSAAIGSLTIDSGVTVTGSNGGYFQAPSIVDNGVIDVTSGAFGLCGTLTGSGAVDIESGASVTLTGVDTASANTVAFNGTNGILTLQSGTLNASQVFTPAISGFNSSDVIDVQGTATGASYSNGILSLTNGTQLSLSGDFTGDVFNATPVSNGYTQISVSSGGDTSTAPTGTGQGDSFAWGSNIAGSWDSAANWNDTSGAGQYPASMAPGSTDIVTINQVVGGVTNVITGVGDAASLTIGGATALQGQFTTGSLVLGDNASSSIGLPSNSSLTVNGSVAGNDGSSIAVNGGQLTIGGDINNGSYDSLTVNDGAATIAGNINNVYADSLNVSGGTAAITGNINNNSVWDSLNVSGGSAAITGNITNNYYYDHLNFDGGTAAIAGSITNNSYDDTITVYGGTLAVGGTVADQGGSDYLQAYNGGSAQFGGLSQSSGGVYVDSASVLEIGTAGGAVAGALTIDSGVTVTASNGAYFQAPSIVDNGVIDVTGGSFDLYGNLTGSGAVDIDSGANAIITGVDGASANTVAFTGINGTLTVNSSALNASQAFTPAVLGLQPNRRHRRTGHSHRRKL